MKIQTQLNIWLATVMLATSLHAEQATEISQYGITWTFDKPYEVGQFVTGDWWVVGPATVVGITPKPGPSTSDQKTSAKSIYGATGLVDDKRMRNGSMLNPGVEGSLGKQGLDSRSQSYDEKLTVQLPVTLQPDDSLLSSVSSETFDAKGKLSTPYVLGEQGVILTKKRQEFALETAAVLTCLAEAPAADAFRPPYAGKAKPIYHAKDIQWDKLPKLAPVDFVPEWEMMERIYQRPWFEIPSGWVTQYFGPGANQPNYGREIQRMSSIASLMLLLDVPKEQKEKLLTSYLQWGIDLKGAADSGRVWFSDGGHWQGRKWPILFASMMLNDEKLREFPPLPASFDRVQPSEACPKPVTVFQEDLDTYYGKGADGQTALWQMNWHGGPRPPFQEKPLADYDKNDKQANGYRFINSASYIGVALAAQLMGARAIWNHDAFFDYVDYYMGPDEKVKKPKWAPKGAEKSADPFMESMWAAYRDQVPEQADGKDNWKFEWIDMKKRTGHWVENPKPASP